MDARTGRHEANTIDERKWLLANGIAAETFVLRRPREIDHAAIKVRIRISSVTDVEARSAFPRYAVGKVADEVPRSSGQPSIAWWQFSSCALRTGSRPLFIEPALEH